MIVEKPMHYDQYKNYDTKELVEKIHEKENEKRRSPI